jgi:hypothetical protein
MSVSYSQTAITARLQGVIDTVGVAGFLKLKSASGVILSSIGLPTPCGVAANGVLTFRAGSMDPSAVGTGDASTAAVTDSIGTAHISGLTVGIPGSGASVIIVNGANTTRITLGQAVQFVAGTIIGA